MRRALFACGLAALGGCGRIRFDLHADGATADGARPAILHAYVLADTPEIEIFDVDSTGSLALSSSSPFPLGVVATDVRGDASGQHLYVTTDDGTSRTIHTLSIERETGALTQVGSQPTGAFPQVIALHPSGRWLYVSSWGTNPYVYGFTIGVDGVLTAMPGSPFAHGGVGGTGYIGITPDGKRLYASCDDHNVYGFSVSMADGSLSVVPAIQWASMDSGPYDVLIEPAGHFGWVAPDTSGGIPGFTINQVDGTLTTTPGSKFGAHGNTTMDATLDRTGTLAFFANQGDGSFDTTAYAIDASTGALTELPGSPIFNGPTDSVLTVATSPIGDDVYYAGGGTSGAKIAHYHATSAGISLVDTTDLPRNPGRLAVVASQ